MPQSLANLNVHIIFSTKRRENMILPEYEQELYSYIGGIVNNNQSKLLAANGTANHIHLLVSINKNITIVKLIGDIKRNSSRWFKTKDIKLSLFEWQDGYGAFSVGYTQIETVKNYIAKQKEHHKKKLFENEFRQFLNKYKVDYDERYLWD